MNPTVEDANEVVATHLLAWKAMEQFALENGRNWRSKLRQLWNSGKDEGGLRLARNVYGPSKIDKFTVSGIRLVVKSDA
jgi:hypothetical protein